MDGFSALPQYGRQQQVVLHSLGSSATIVKILRANSSLVNDSTISTAPLYPDIQIHRFRVVLLLIHRVILLNIFLV